MSISDRHYYFRMAAIGCLLIGIIIIAVTLWRSNQGASGRFGDDVLLTAMWERHKTDYWDSTSGRTLDTQQNSITTSEGQSYTMMRAVWMNDRSTFDLAWEWTQNNLQHRDDRLFAWRWGERSDGSYGVLTDIGGQNSASDADIDIAFSLLMAARHWRDNAYRDDAVALIDSIWEEEVEVIQGRPYLYANDLEKDSPSSGIINPSYYAPYAFRTFATVDPDHDWLGLADASYDLLEAATTSPLDTGSSANLPPDWVVIDKATGNLSASPIDNLTTNFSYDANRTLWRVALDYQWNNEPRARALLERFSFLNEAYDRDGALYSTYSHSGETLVRDEVPAMYGTALGYFLIEQPEQATTIYEDELRPVYQTDAADQANAVSYYSDNWAWFGMALANERLSNLAE